MVSNPGQPSRQAVIQSDDNDEEPKGAGLPCDIDEFPVAAADHQTAELAIQQLIFDDLDEGELATVGAEAHDPLVVRELSDHGAEAAGVGSDVGGESRMSGHYLTPPLSQARSKTGEDSSPVEVLGIDHREGRQALWRAVGEVHGPNHTRTLS